MFEALPQIDIYLRPAAAAAGGESLWQTLRARQPVSGESLAQLAPDTRAQRRLAETLNEAAARQWGLDPGGRRRPYAQVSGMLLQLRGPQASLEQLLDCQLEVTPRPAPSLDPPRLRFVSQPRLPELLDERLTSQIEALAGPQAAEGLVADLPQTSCEILGHQIQPLVNSCVRCGAQVSPPMGQQNPRAVGALLAAGLLGALALRSRRRGRGSPRGGS